MSNDKKQTIIWIDEAQYFGKAHPAQLALFRKMDEKFKSLVENSLETFVIDIDHTTNLEAEIQSRLVAAKDCMQHFGDGIRALLEQSICVSQVGQNHLVLNLRNNVRFLPIVMPKLKDFKELDGPELSKGKVIKSGSKHKRNRWR